MRTLPRRAVRRAPIEFGVNNPRPTDAAAATVDAAGVRFLTGYYTFLIFLLIALAAGRSFAARPLETDDAGTVDPGSVEVELSADYQDDPGTQAWGLPVCIKTGIVPGLDVGLGSGWQWLDEAGLTESGMTDLELGSKWNFLMETNALPSLSLTAAVKLPTADDDRGLGSGEADWDVTGVLSKSLNDRFAVHLNAGYTWVGIADSEDGGDVLHGSTAMEFQLTDSFCAVSEVLAEKELEDDADTMVFGNVGVCWAVSENLVIDAAVGTGLSGEDSTDFRATVGLTWLFNLK